MDTTICSNVKRLCQRVVASVKKICLKKCQNFRITLSSNYSKNLGNISSKIFSKLPVIHDYFLDIYLKFPITQLFLKLFSKYRKNFLKVACFEMFLSFSLNYLRISEHMSISSEFWRHTNFLKICKSFFPQIILKVRKNLTPYFHGIVCSKICLKSAF